MTATSDSPVLIAGGGIGGLAAALALARCGIACHVFEKRAAFSEEGAGIQIGPNGMRVLAHLGVDLALRNAAAAPDALQVRDAMTGAALTRLPIGSWIAERHGAPYWTAHRQDLHRALLETARAESRITLETDATVEGARDTAAGIAVDVNGRGAREGRALIAADGLWSPVRGKVIGADAPRMAGKTAYRTVIPVSALPEALAVNDVHIWLTDGAHVVHYPVRGGREHAFVIIYDEVQETAGWSTRVEAAFVKARAQRLAPSLRVLLEAGDAWRMWTLHELSMPPHWAKGHAALLGDAAHPVLPFLAQGAVLALEDALVLAGELASSDGATAAALQRYEGKRRARALRVQSASRRNGRIYHMSGMAKTARDAVLAKAPPALLMRQYDWLYGWRPPQ